MGIEALLKNLAVGMEPNPVQGRVPLPRQGPDPHAVAQFSLHMEEGVGGSVGTIPKDGPGVNTLGELLTRTQVEGGRDSGKSEAWLNTIFDLLQKEEVSHMDLYRVQALASLTQVEITRNSSVTRSMDNGLKTMLKNS